MNLDMELRTQRLGAVDGGVAADPALDRSASRRSVLKLLAAGPVAGATGGLAAGGEAKSRSRRGDRERRGERPPTPTAAELAAAPALSEGASARAIRPRQAQLFGTVTTAGFRVGPGIRVYIWRRVQGSTTAWDLLGYDTTNGFGKYSTIVARNRVYYLQVYDPVTFVWGRDSGNVPVTTERKKVNLRF